MQKPGIIIQLSGITDLRQTEVLQWAVSARSHGLNEVHGVSCRYGRQAVVRCCGQRSWSDIVGGVLKIEAEVIWPKVVWVVRRCRWGRGIASHALQGSYKRWRILDFTKIWTVTVSVGNSIRVEDFTPAQVKSKIGSFNPPLRAGPQVSYRGAEVNPFVQWRRSFRSVRGMTR